MAKAVLRSCMVQIQPDLLQTVHKTLLVLSNVQTVIDTVTKVVVVKKG